MSPTYEWAGLEIIASETGGRHLYSLEIQSRSFISLAEFAQYLETS